MKKFIGILAVVLFAIFLIYIATYQVPTLIQPHPQGCKLEYGASLCLCTSEPVGEFVYQGGAWRPKSGKEVEIFECEGQEGILYIPVFNSGDENITDLKIYLDGEVYSAEHVIEWGRPYPMKLGPCTSSELLGYSNLRVKWCCGEICSEDVFYSGGFP